MDVDLHPGTYVVAVSGGIDSMVLLHVLREKSGLELVVAHFDHGIRSDSEADKLFVERAARQHGLRFVAGEGKLGPGASEAAARRARYEFLETVRLSSGARAIVTAHHQDDLIETAMLNLLRGTGRKGLSSLRSTKAVQRPLLGVPKTDIRNYAAAHDIAWREDSTNESDAYLRNYLRHHVTPRLTPAMRQQWLELIKTALLTNEQLDSALAELLPDTSDNLPRDVISNLPDALARELMAAWLRTHGLREFDRRLLSRLVVAAKTASPGSRFDIYAGSFLRVGQEDLALDRSER